MFLDLEIGAEGNGGVDEGDYTVGRGVGEQNGRSEVRTDAPGKPHFSARIRALQGRG